MGFFLMLNYIYMFHQIILYYISFLDYIVSISHFFAYGKQKTFEKKNEKFATDF